MASIHQSSWVFTLKAINGVSSSKTNLFSSANLRAYPLRTPKISASLEDSIEDTSPSNSAETGSGDQLGSSDPVKLAFSRAKSYKKSLKSNPGPKQNQNPVAELVGNVNVDGRSVSDDIDGGTKEVPASVKLAMEKAREYKKNKGILGMVGGDKKAREGENVSAGSISDDADGGTKEVPASVKLAMEKAREHKKNKEVLGMAGGDKKAGERENVSTGSISDDADGGYVDSGNLSNDAGGGTKEVPISVKLAMEKAREYKNKGVTTTADGNKNVGEKDSNLGLEKTNVGNSGGKFVEKRVTKKEELTISSIDFLGLGFSDKRQSKGLPAGLVPVTDPFADGDLPEVELIVGDASKFGTATPVKPELNEDDSDLYKPKVSTWGVFPRPSNISKTYGGGRVIRPGEVLETEEDRAAKEARTRQLLAAYKNKMGLTIDAKLKAECEKALKDGDYFMDLGKLKEALPYYEKVMKELAFQVIYFMIWLSSAVDGPWPLQFVIRAKALAPSLDSSFRWTLGSANPLLMHYPEMVLEGHNLYRVTWPRG
uniref:Uncharacterized protein n=1 Tax=Nelumbo nucifera TaxID=4432 RepID=A0A822ZGI9_NELNU|nr:TPA_asm: hypothetical protein HUJ06_000819 [Nelumbo nucifera]